MKKILLIALLLSVVNAENAMFQSETNPNIGEIVKSEEIYFGKYDGFLKNLKEGSKGALFQGLYGTVKNGVNGGIANLVIGAVTPFILTAQMDQKYLRVIRNEDSNGTVSLNKVMFIGAVDGDAYSEKEIAEIINTEYPFSFESNTTLATATQSEDNLTIKD